MGLAQQDSVDFMLFKSNSLLNEMKLSTFFSGVNKTFQTLYFYLIVGGFLMMTSLFPLETLHQQEYQLCLLQHKKKMKKKVMKKI